MSFQILFESLLKRYQIVKEKPNSDFIFDCGHFLYYECHKINLNRGGYIFSRPSISRLLAISNFILNPLDIL